MKSIEIGNGTFDKLIESGNVYVDKTGILYNLITSGSTYFFCSRPRRFGKTLALSTLDAIFRGRKELFRGLRIYDADYDWKEYPVIHIDLGSIQASDAEELKKSLKREIERWSERYSIEYDKDAAYYDAWKDLILKLAEKEKVVILIDEYDKILSSNIYNPKAEEMRDVLRGFFEVIKAQSRYIRFAFITGVTKFAKVSIFSSMNNLNDISLDEEYAALFGYTEEELEHYFGEYIERGKKASGLSHEEYMEELAEKYNGNRFSPDSEVTVYNPVSVGLFFSKGGKNFGNYWIDTGNTKLLMDAARKAGFDISKDVTAPISRSDIAVFDILSMASSHIDPYAYRSLLFQTGYLTIKGIDRKNRDAYILDFPNDEVAEAYSENLLGLYAGDRAAGMLRASGIRTSFSEGDTEAAIDEMKSIYAAIPYNLLKKADEAHYSTAFFCIMKSLGAEIGAEIETSRGRIDAVLETKMHIYIMEFKYNRPADMALEQIHDTKYYEPYLAKKQKCIHLIGMSFSSEERNIGEWKEEIL